MIQISVADSFKQPAPLEGQYDAAAHGETSHTNQEPGTGNNAHMKGVHDVLQVVKEIQDTLKSELHDIRTKVNFLYVKFTSVEDKNFDEDLHNTNSHQKSKNHMPPNPTSNSPPPPPSRHLSIPTIQHPVVEDTFKDDILEHESQSSNKRRKAPHQPNGYDCGLLLYMFMDDNYPTMLQMKSFQSECQCLFWARFLALFPGNTNLLSLKKNAQNHYNKVLSTGEVVPNVKMRPAPMKKLRGKAAALLD
ncbi:hypothetical protein Q3G72_004384 [Acer saccharum]|nr:hypothetical protein Q3G72_004384 [Acer saccharum]